MTSRDLPGEAGAPRRRGWWSSDRFQRPAFMLPTVVVLLCLTLYPFIYSVYLSLHFVRLTTLHRKVWAGLQNYYDLFSNELFLKALANTAMLAVTTITLEIVLGFIAAKVFFELADKRWINTLRSAFLVPMMVTPIIIGVVFNYIFNPTLGIANYVLEQLGIPAVSWFGDPLAARLTILLINVWQWTPFMALLILAGLVSIRSDIIEAARVDGARWHHILFAIEIPSVASIILLGVILRIIEILRFFDIIYVTTRGGPGDATMVLTLFTYQQDFQYFQVGLGSASAVVILAISLVVTTFAVRLMRRLEND